MSSIRFSVSALALVLSTTTHAAIIDTYSIGTGANFASIQIDQEDGDGYLFNVHWDSANYTSWDALVDIDSEVDALSMTYDTYSWGIFLTGISIDGDLDYGTGDQWPIENFWHFWIHGTGAWEMAMTGATDSVLVDGARDAWVFGSAIPPQSVPAPGSIAITLASIAACRGRCRSVHMRASRAH